MRMIRYDDLDDVYEEWLQEHYTTLQIEEGEHPCFNWWFKNDYLNDIQELCSL